MSDDRLDANDAGGTASPRLVIEIITLFPEVFTSFLQASLLGKAIASGLIVVERTNPRDFAPGRHRQVDDSPYGGGPGMVLRPDPVAAAIDDVENRRGRAHRLLLAPSGRLFDQKCAADLAPGGASCSSVAATREWTSGSLNSTPTSQ
jgi:tRNA (guanine-N1)-methyltransferase